MLSEMEQTAGASVLWEDLSCPISCLVLAKGSQRRNQLPSPAGVLGMLANTGINTESHNSFSS